MNPLIDIKYIWSFENLKNYISHTTQYYYVIFRQIPEITFMVTGYFPAEFYIFHFGKITIDKYKNKICFKKVDLTRATWLNRKTLWESLENNDFLFHYAWSGDYFYLVDKSSCC
jgi:hypothetical protein